MIATGAYKHKFPSKIITYTDHAKIIINERQVKIDIESVERVKYYRWSLKKTGEICTTVNSRTILLHRFIMNAYNPKIEVDHIEHDYFDCRKSSLRLVTHQQNSFNRRRNKNKHNGIYKGTIKNGGKWDAKIQSSYLGTFKTEKEAALVYNEEAKKRFGLFASLNNF